MSRRIARRDAFVLIYQLGGCRQADSELIKTQLDAYFQSVSDNDAVEYADISSDVATENEIKFIIDEVYGTLSHRREIDEDINAFAKDWTTDRMSQVDLAILRLAVYELKFAADIPAGVSINEAVEFAKTFSSEEAPVFINGLLGRLTGELELGG